jgi:Flp pilus assembly protein TadG
MKKRNRFDLLRSDGGASLVELAILLPLFMLLMAVAVDLGRAYYLVLELQGAANAAAAYGVQNPTDTAGMSTVAQDNAPNVPGLTVGTHTYGCECSDGTSYSASCASVPACTGLTEVYRVNITVTATYKPLFPWPAIASTMSFSSSASMRSA